MSDLILISDGEEEDDATPPPFPSKRVRKNPTPTNKDPPPPGYASTPFLVEDDDIPLSHGTSLGAVASSNREDKFSGKRVISLESDSEDSPRPPATSKKYEPIHVDSLEQRCGVEPVCSDADSDNSTDWMQGASFQYSLLNHAVKVDSDQGKEGKSIEKMSRQKQIGDSKFTSLSVDALPKKQTLKDEKMRASEEKKLRKEDIERESWILTDEGKTYAAEGSPEVQLFLAVPAEGSISIDELQKKLAPSVFEIGFSQAGENKWVEMGNQVSRTVQNVEDKVKNLLLQTQQGLELDKESLNSLKARKLIAPQLWKGYSVKKGPNYAPKRTSFATDLTRENLQISCIAMAPKVKRRRTYARSETHIQDLPDCLLSHTLGFLPTKIAATTSVLSKRWRKLFALSPYLSFEFPDHKKAASVFINFVEGVLAMRENVVLKKFSLDIHKGVHKDRANNLILSALGCRVSVLELYLHKLRGDWYGPHPNIYVDELLVQLVIGTTCLIIAPEAGFRMPSLKVLFLDDVWFEDDSTGFSKLLSGCPVLDELTLKDMNWSEWDICCVSSTSLTKLQISWEEHNFFRGSNGCPKSVSFHTPNLEYLDYADDDVIQLPSVNCENIVEATLKLGMEGEHDEEIEESVNGFWLRMKNIEILCLREYTLDVLSLCGEDEIPVFTKLEQLNIKTEWRVESESLSSLLNKCPNIETIYLERKILERNTKEKTIDCEGEDRLAFMEKVLAFLEEMNLED